MVSVNIAGHIAPLRNAFSSLEVLYHEASSVGAYTPFKPHRKKK